MTGAPDLDHTLGELQNLAGPSYPQVSRVQPSHWLITDLLISLAFVATVAGVIAGAI